MGRTKNILATILCWAVGCLAFAASAAPAHAGESLYAECFASFDTKPDITQLDDKNTSWQCGEDAYPEKAAFIAARFAASQDGVQMQHFVGEVAHFDTLSVFAKNSAGAWSSETFAAEDLRPISYDLSFLVPLPKVSGQPEAYYVTFQNLYYEAGLYNASVASENPALDPDHTAKLLFVTLMLGMILLPILFDLTAWKTLRASFPIWHAAACLSFAVMIAIFSGLIHLVIELDVPTSSTLLTLADGLSMCALLMFTRTYLANERSARILIKSAPYVALWGVAVTLLDAFPRDIASVLPDGMYFLGMIPLQVLIGALLIDGLLKKSRAARFQVVGLIPLIVFFFWQSLPLDSLVTFSICIMCEIVFTAMGVADRVENVRRERDQALAETEALERLSERDPMTGLFNRRSIERRFETLQQDGFDTVALLDLDLFKDINDRFGHATGDAALKATADALRSEQGRNIIAIRMGGEEFMLIARGDNAQERLERIRRAIPTRIAHDVPGLDRTVTASMGVIEIQASGTHWTTLDDLYRRSDMLLYEAKENGRNQTMSEKVTLFHEHRKGEDKGGQHSHAA